MVSYISSFFFNLVEKNLLRVKKFSKCRENGIACLRKGKLRRRRRHYCHAYAPMSNTAGPDNHEKINSCITPLVSYMGVGLRLVALRGKLFISHVDL